MFTTSNAGGKADTFGRSGWQGGCGVRRWKPLEVAAVVMAFWVYWPLAVGLVGLKLAQRRGFRFEDAATWLRDQFGASPAGASRPSWRPFSAASTGNAAFNEWRAAEMAKLDEERRKLDAAEREFTEHLDNLRRARDREEFDGFMRARAART